ncbi:MAG TPA: S8 family serine peptidase [Sandaracinaceae bacterium LLY-WYZ-13_1]|nr:S8 family serine peptidase [Sandaracinaceae bacterium LLY-WYZ-13_1]
MGRRSALGGWVAAWLAAGLAAGLPPAPARAQLPRRWPRAPLTEVARAAVGADVARDAHGVDGRGAALCLVDTGVDATHPALLDDAGRPRVRWVLDAFAPPRGVHPSLEAAGGAVVGPEALAASRGDPHGHGTAMASIAAGREGLAPGASLIVARAWDDEAGGFPDEAVVRGVGFCRAAAAADPALDPARLVVLLSLGGHDGAHDGSGPFERALAAHAREVPVVVAAGNDGARAVRAAGRIFASETATVEVRVPRASRPDATLALTVRTEAPFSLEAPDGAALDALRTDRATDAALGPGRVRVEPSDDRPGLARVVLEAPAAGTHRLRVHGPARFEVWLAGHRLGAPFFAPSLGGGWVRADEQIAIPATAPGLIAVGATVARATVEGLALEPDGEPGGPARYTAAGPTVSGAPTPDLSAPGGWILAALSRDVRPGDPDNLAGGRLAAYEADGRVAVRGTSAAAAVVAGALLLALERAAADGLEARARLIASADGDGWDPRRGWGALDVARLLSDGGATPRGAALELVATRPLVPGDPALWVAVRGAPAPLAITVDGRAATRAEPIAGVATVPLDPGALSVGVPVRVEAAAGAARASVDVPVVLDRSPRGAVAPAGGGCAASPTRAAPSTPPFVLALLALSRAARRPRRRGRPCRG